MAKIFCLVVLACVSASLAQGPEYYQGQQQLGYSGNQQNFNSQQQQQQPQNNYPGQQQQQNFPGGNLGRSSTAIGLSRQQQQQQQGGNQQQQGGNSYQDQQYPGQQNYGPQSFLPQNQGSQGQSQLVFQPSFYSQQPSSFDYSRRGSNDIYEPANYEFGYRVSSPENNVEYGHQESRQGDRTQGRYQVVLPDGVTQVVDYMADQDGYQPSVTYHNHNNYAQSRY